MVKMKNLLRKTLKVIGIILSVIIVILLILFIIFNKQVMLVKDYFDKAAFIDKNTAYTTVDTTLTMDQRLSDFDYMYDIVCLQNPNKEYLEKQFGLSYQDIYDRYREKVLETKDEYDYYSLLTSFLSVLPGQHNVMLLPDFDKYVVHGMYAQLERMWTQDIKDHVSSWHDAFRDNVYSYDQRALLFRYINGEYYAFTISLCENMTEYNGAKLLTLNGKNVDERVYELYERYVPTYDSENDKFFRKILIFNESIGDKYTAELEMPDGKIVKVDLYDDPGFDLAISDKNKVYGETTEETDDDTASDDKPTSYFIAEDKERKLVYIRHDRCLSSEAQRLVDDIKTAVDNTNAEYIILDIRDNSGGDSGMVKDRLSPALFMDDISFKANVKLPLNGPAEYFADTPMSWLGNFKNFKKKDGYITYTEDLSVDGRAEKEYKIYVLVSSVTFSSGDIMAQIAKKYKNATVIGSNTGGEGYCGALFNDWLPESRFTFAYAPGVNTDYPEDSVYGTEPDIHMSMLKEYYDKRDELEAQGTEVYTYEGRQLWDGILIKTLEIIDAQ